jgi:hypothetical protein
MTSIHPKDCERYREDFLVALDRAPDAEGVSGEGVVHAEPCESCTAWREETLLVTGILGSLDRLVAPPQLEACIAEDISTGAGALQAVLRGLEPQTAPAELDLLLAQELTELAKEDPLPRWISLLEELPRQKAPLVLERLVDEELADSEKAITKRFVGGLFRHISPDRLEARLHSALRSEGLPATPRLRLLKWGSAAAAALVAWVSVPAFQAEATPKFHFEVVEVANLQEMNPFVRALASDLAGGMLKGMQPNVESKETDGGGSL